MSRFEDIKKGKRARKTIEIPLLLDTEQGGLSELLVDLVVLNGNETGAALTAAAEYARKQGVSDPKDGDPHYDLGLMVHTLARACVDHEVPGSFSFYFCPTKEPENFDAAATAILESFDPERIHWLYQQWKIWQEWCSPWGKAKTEEEIIGYLIKLRGVSDPATPFKELRLASVGSLLLTTVNRLAVLLEDKSQSGSFTSTNSTGSESEPEIYPTSPAGDA